MTPDAIDRWVGSTFAGHPERVDRQAGADMTESDIAIIGAGFGGLGAAIQLKRNGIHDFVVFEQADDLGGTWRDNSYPGCACDVPSHLYSYSFALNPDGRTRSPARRRSGTTCGRARTGSASGHTYDWGAAWTAPSGTRPPPDGG